MPLPWLIWTLCHYHKLSLQAGDFKFAYVGIVPQPGIVTSNWQLIPLVWCNPNSIFIVLYEHMLCFIRATTASEDPQMRKKGNAGKR
jgi:hypothetical protein